MLIVFALGSTALRGIAEADNEPATPAANENVAIDAVLQASFTVSPYFQREKIPSTYPAFKHHGAVYFDVAAIRKSQLWPVILLLLTEQPPSEAGQLSFDAIKSIAADCLMTVRAKQGETRGQIQFGASQCRIECQQDIVWQKAIKFLFPQAKESQQDDRQMFETLCEAAGPFPIKLYPLGARELVATWANPEKRENLSTWLAPSDEDRKHAWAAEWDAVSGGLFAVVMTRETSDQPISDEEFPGIELVNFLNRSIDLISVGIDFSSNSVNCGVIVRLGCTKDSDPQGVWDVLLKLIAMEQKEFQNEQLPVKDSELEEGFQFNQMIFQGLAKARSRVVRGERNVVEFRTECVLPEVWQRLKANADRVEKASTSQNSLSDQPNDTADKK
jgi:hypothetical protein